MTLSVYLMYGGASDAIGNGTTTSVLIPVSKSSVVFEKVLAPLQESFLYGASKEAFRYPSAFLFNNSILQEKYKAFRANRRQAGYSEEELREGYGFLLFDDIDKAAKLGETGVLTGNSTCKTLGDPSKGVYIARYSDCLAPDHWYSGKSGFIVIIKLTKVRGAVDKIHSIGCFKQLAEGS
ncbi:protein TASOR [Gadus morhua]|uniref:protein TASOR n=1 Tax=Gadus morhua TaxID=8049 RepID=UPI0011B59D01|nr:protein TASOR-like [Gadus morhua]